MKYGIAIFPSKSIQDDANALRKRYDPKYALIPPHITIKYPFTLDDGERDALIKQLKQMASETKPFTINVNKVSSFAPLTNTIYYKIEQVPELTALNEALNPEESLHPFIPHITIAQELRGEEFSDVYGTLQLMKVEFEDIVDRLSLCYQLENGSWTVYETFVFGN